MTLGPSVLIPNEVKAKVQKLIAEYGAIAAGLHFSIFGLNLVAFAVAIEMGIELPGTVGKVGTWGIAYAGTQLTKPFRIAALFILTPLVAKLLGKSPAAAALPDGVDAQAQKE